MAWATENITDSLYLAKFVNCPDIIGDWVSEHGGLSGKDLLEFGCGEGTMALGMALRKGARSVIGVDVLDIHQQCLSLARKQIGLQWLPGNLALRQIAPGEEVESLGQFDLIYSWSVFEHFSQDVISTALKSINAALKPEGLFFLQISPLYYSPNGSHMAPWISEPWAHLSMQQDAFQRALLSAPSTPPSVRSEWSVYIPADADAVTERKLLWDTISRSTSLRRRGCAEWFRTRASKSSASTGRRLTCLPQSIWRKFIIRIF